MLNCFTLMPADTNFVGDSSAKVGEWLTRVEVTAVEEGKVVRVEIGESPGRIEKVSRFLRTMD